MHTSCVADVLGSFGKTVRGETYRYLHTHTDTSISIYIYTGEQRKTNMLPAFPIADLFLIRLS